MGTKKQYSKVLKKENLRNTSHRQSILEAIGTLKEPVSAESLYLTLKGRGVSISLSTVYRVLDVLVDRKIVVKTDLTDNNKSLYEMNQEGHRHHLVCVKCKRIIPVDECPFHDYACSLEEKFDFSITDHKLEMFGYCQKCRTGDGSVS